MNKPIKKNATTKKPVAKKNFPKKTIAPVPKKVEKLPEVEEPAVTSI